MHRPAGRPHGDERERFDQVGRQCGPAGQQHHGHDGEGEGADVGRRHHREAALAVEVGEQPVGGVGQAVDVQQAGDGEVGDDHEDGGDAG